ncbi:hypothetical protein Gotur_013553 [Gossypium turneri]
MEMHQTNRVLRQFGFRILILVAPERRRQIRVEREQRGPLNPKRRDDDMGPSTVPTQSPSPMPQPTTLTLQPLQIMPGALEWMAQCISFPDDTDSTDDI